MSRVSPARVHRCSGAQPLTCSALLTHSSIQGQLKKNSSQECSGKWKVRSEHVEAALPDVKHNKRVLNPERSHGAQSVWSAAPAPCEQGLAPRAECSREVTLCTSCKQPLRASPKHRPTRSILPCLYLVPELKRAGFALSLCKPRTSC